MNANLLTTASRRWRTYYFGFTLFLLSAVALTIGLSSISSAATPLAQSYTAKGTIPLGSIVSLKKNSSDEVIASDMKSIDNIFGVVINSDSALLSLSNSGANQVQVATSGIIQVLVSDMNGKIAQGDHITASGISGVGMKADTNVRIVGIAQGEMTSATKQTYKEGNQDKSVMIGEVPVLINVSYFFKEPDKTIIPSALQNVANSVAGKAVSPVPIFISAAIFLIILIIVAAMIYSMIRSSIISVGRNPLSQSAVYRDLIQLSGLVLVILGVGLATIYFVLTKL